MDLKESLRNSQSPYPILVLEKTFRLLGSFDAEHREWGVTELSRKLEINKSTVSKILSMLENHRFLSKDRETKKYGLGLRLFELGSLVTDQMDLQRIALPHMEELNKKVGETVHLVVMDSFEIVYINKVESPQSLRIVTRVGGRLPAYCTGVGKVLLAALSPEELDLYLRKTPLKKHTRHTVIDPKELKKTLAQIRLQGYARDLEEFSIGLMCVAAPIFNFMKKEVGAVSISGPTHRVQDKGLEYFVSLVKKTAHQISHRLGYNGGNPADKAA